MNLDRLNIKDQTTAYAAKHRQEIVRYIMRHRMKFRKTLGTRIFVDCIVLSSLAYQCKLAFDSHEEWQIFLMAFLIGSYLAFTVTEL